MLLSLLFNVRQSEERRLERRDSSIPPTTIANNLPLVASLLALRSSPFAPRPPHLALRSSQAFLFAFFFARLARSETRGIQVVFGDKAVVKRARDGKFTFNVRGKADEGGPCLYAALSPSA